MISFCLNQLNQLRHFIPICKELNKLGFRPKFYLSLSKKYNCLSLKRNYQLFHKDLHDNQVSLSLDNVSNYQSEGTKEKEVLVCLEGVGLPNKINKIDTCVSLTNFCDFIYSTLQIGRNVYSYVDHVFMTSSFHAKYYNRENKKNLYLGTPKYDYKISKDSVFEKYNLKKENSYVLVAYPNPVESKKIDLEKILNDIKNLGFEIIIKSRTKNSVSPKFKNYFIVDDFSNCMSVFPSASEELLSISSFLLNFGSCFVEEAIFRNCPVLNFDVKKMNEGVYPFTNGAKISPSNYNEILEIPGVNTSKCQFDFLYDNNVVKNIGTNYNKEMLDNTICELMENRKDNENFKDLINKFYPENYFNSELKFESPSVKISKKILGLLESD